VVRLGYVSLFTDLSTEMILGILPVFIVEQLGATAAVLGLIEGTAEAVNDFFRVLTGVITDRFAKRKPFVLLGYALSSFAKPLFSCLHVQYRDFCGRLCGIDTVLGNWQDLGGSVKLARQL
jgi:Na+/melibiose symporter-like transporter